MGLRDEKKVVFGRDRMKLIQAKRFSMRRTFLPSVRS